jgi:hypothetical protein
MVLNDINKAEMDGTHSTQEKRNVYSILAVKPEERRQLQDLCVDGRIILQ